MLAQRSLRSAAVVSDLSEVRHVLDATRQVSEPIFRTGREYFHVGLRRNTSCVSTLRKMGSDTFLVESGLRCARTLVTPFAIVVSMRALLGG